MHIIVVQKNVHSGIIIQIAVAKKCNRYQLVKPSFVRPPDAWLMNFLSLFLYQYTAFSSRAVDGHQMYYGGLVVGRASTIDPSEG